MVNLGDVFPNFTANTSKGEIKFHDWLGGSWAILFSHPADYTPVCTTELARVVTLAPEFEKRGVKLIALSCDGVNSHVGWGKDVMTFAGGKQDDLPYPIVADEERKLAVELGMIDPDERTKEGLPLTARAVFIIGPDKKLKLSLLYPATTGRNFNGILRVVDSLQLTATQKVATPVDWEKGQKCMVLPTIPMDEARKLFPNMEVRDVPSGEGYLRFTPMS
ncbi:glutathione peroxidase [Aplysia californica]|uniref:Glutathione peroxidase n=1 Tax=Aplysia californica TaxID=6500 RepID=Q8MUT9_APLCA|nr:glutathione peroxidase [Aplysia californica]AAM44290.1 glutathione peroxidase [Aplysia californica]